MSESFSLTSSAYLPFLLYLWFFSIFLPISSIFRSGQNRIHLYHNIMATLFPFWDNYFSPRFRKFLSIYLWRFKDIIPLMKLPLPPSLEESHILCTYFRKGDYYNLSQFLIMCPFSISTSMCIHRKVNITCYLLTKCLLNYKYNWTSISKITSGAFWERKVRVAICIVVLLRQI